MPEVEKRLPETPADYAPFLTLYYEEEIMGEAFFVSLGQFFPEPHQKKKLELLSVIERCVADGVRPLLDRHGLTPRSDEELHAAGVEDIGRYKDFTWQDLLEDITTNFPGFMDEFAALARIAPDEDQELLIPFTTHEVAGIEFAEKELAGDPDSADVLTRFIQEHSA